MLYGDGGDSRATESMQSQCKACQTCTPNAAVSRSGSKKQLMLSVAGLERAKLEPLCKEAAAKEAR